MPTQSKGNSNPKHPPKLKGNSAPPTGYKKPANKRTPIRPTGRGTGIRVKGANDSTHEKIDKPERTTMRSSLVDKIKRLTEVLLPDVALGFDLSEVLERLKEDAAYDVVEKRWKEFPKDLQPGQEDEIKAFFQKLLNAIDNALRHLSENKPVVDTDLNTDASSRPHANQKAPSPFPAPDSSDPTPNESSSALPSYPQQLRTISSSTHKKAPEGETSLRKPDNIFLKKIIELIEVHWEQIDAILEIKYIDNPNSIYDAKLKIWQYAKFIFRNQHNRRFVLGVCLLGTSLDIHKEPLEFLRVIAGLAYAKDKFLGFDTSISVEKGRGHVSLNGNEYTVENVVHAESGILGRGTVCFKATNGESDPSKLKTFAVKDAWVDKSRVQKEAEILQALNELKITNIPRLVDSGIVQVDGKNDSTANIRTTLVEVMKNAPADEPSPHDLIVEDRKCDEAKDAQVEDKDKDKPEGKDKGAEVDAAVQAPGKDKKLKAKRWKINWKKYFARDHYRLVLWPFGRPLTHFRCLEELLLGIRDIIGVIEQLQKNKYLHRDISINNVVLADKTEDVDGNPIPKELLELRRRLEGFLIDFDYSINIGRGDLSALADRTGTVPFMAIEVLKAHLVAKPHTYYHDLESVFYVLIWVCTISAGPGILRNFKEYENSAVYRWNDREPSEKGMEDVAFSKIGYTQTDEMLETLMQDFHEYFRPIRDCLLGIRRCLFPNPVDSEYRDFLLAKIDRFTGTKDPEKLREVKKWRLCLPLKDRAPRTLFQDFYDAIDKAVEELPEEHRLEALSDVKGNDEAEGYDEELVSDDACTTNGESQFMLPLKDRADTEDEDESRDILRPLPSFWPKFINGSQDEDSPPRISHLKRKKGEDDEGEVSSSSSNKKQCDALSDPELYTIGHGFLSSEDSLESH